MKRNALEPDELITAVHLPAPPGRSSSPRSARATRWSSRSARSGWPCIRDGNGRRRRSARPAPTPRRGSEAEEFLAERAVVGRRPKPLPDSREAPLRRAGRRPRHADRRRPRQRRLPAARAGRAGPADADLGLGRIPDGGARMRLNVTVNGEHRQADDVWEGESLLYVLRERLGLPGSKNACEQGECGSCTVYLDGVPGVLLPGRGRAGRGPRGRARSRGWPTATRWTRSSSPSWTRARSSAASARPAWSSPRTTCCNRVPRPVRRGDPRGAGRQPVPLHRLREDPRRRARGGARMESHEDRHRQRRDRHRRRCADRVRERVTSSSRTAGSPRSAEGVHAGRGRRAHRRRGCLVTPGLVNTHHHLYQWATRGYAQDADALRVAGRAVPGLGPARRRRSPRRRHGRHGPAGPDRLHDHRRPPLRLPPRRRRPGRGAGRTRPTASASGCTLVRGSMDRGSPRAACRRTTSSRTPKPR